MEGYLNGVAELLRSPTPVRKAGEEPVMRRDRRRWRRFLEMETNEAHGHRMTGRGCNGVAVNVFKNMK